MSEQSKDFKVADKPYDLFIIGGGVNGCGVARDAAGRGFSVALAEMNDLASATSSASTKLFHGGLRYLEYFELRLVRESLIEREVLLQAMPHISWPLRFVLPYSRNMRFETKTPLSRMLTGVFPGLRGRRPAWLIRLGLFLYDHMGGRKLLPGTKVIDLIADEVGAPLKRAFSKAFEYSDCWVDDSRLVVLNARDAQIRGARIMPRTKVVCAERQEGLWRIETLHTQTGRRDVFATRCLINAGGPWVEDVLTMTKHRPTGDGVRLVRGSHIIVRKLYEHAKCYVFQGQDGRIVFTIPYEGDFTLIGTTDVDHPDLAVPPVCSDEEADYLLDCVCGYFDQAVARADIVARFSGVRPLYDDGAGSASATTRDYVLQLDDAGGVPLLSIFGGKITTYRKLAESVMHKIAPFFAKMPENWTAHAVLPGGDFTVDGFENLVAELETQYAFLPEGVARRLVRAYGTESWHILGPATSLAELGADFGGGVFAAELDWIVDKEWVAEADDFVWRRTRLGLRLSGAQIAMIDDYVKQRHAVALRN